MTSSALTPAALAEIRERDAACTRCGMPGDGAYPIIPVTGEHADWHICALALYHASIAKDATISRLTAELAAARKPQELTELLGELRSAVTYMRDAVVAVRRHEGSALADQYLLRAEEIAAVIAKADGAQDGGEDKS